MRNNANCLLVKAILLEHRYFFSFKILTMLFFIYQFSLIGARGVNIKQATRPLSTILVKLKPESSNITIRKASLNDIPGIRACNLQNLPENYNDEWYRSCLHRWPELCLVATSNQPGGGGGGGDDREEVVGYAFAKVDPLSQSDLSPSSPISSLSHQVVAYDNSSPPPPSSNDANKWTELNKSQRFEQRLVYIGHINSLAVNAAFRRCNVAKTLMNVIHKQLYEIYDVDIVSLHVRASNHAALKLYEGSDYYCIGKFHNYYEDGEDALLLRLRGLRQRVSNQNLAYEGQD